MKKFVLFLALTGAGVSFVFAWGAWGHQHINRSAVFALPAGIRPFFYNHIDFITEEAVVPDLRKYTINDKGGEFTEWADMLPIKSINWGLLQPRTGITTLSN